MQKRKHHLWGTSPGLCPPGSWLCSRRHSGVCVQPLPVLGVCWLRVWVEGTPQVIRMQLRSPSSGETPAWLTALRQGPGPRGQRRQHPGLCPAQVTSPWQVRQVVTKSQVRRAEEGRPVQLRSHGRESPSSQHPAPFKNTQQFPSLQLLLP